MKWKLKRKQINQAVLRFLCLLLLTIVMIPQKAMADENTGTIAVRENPRVGFSLTLYKVADISDQTLIYTESFDGIKETVGNEYLDAESQGSKVKELAELLKDWVSDEANAVTPDQKDVQTNSEGIAYFEDLTAGYYLIVANNVITKDDMKYIANPVLVALTEDETGELYVEVDMKFEKTPITPNTPPDTPSDEELPKTGQLWWPIPVLATAGAFFLILSRVGNKKNS